jgi:hypothetical protein
MRAELLADGAGQCGDAFDALALGAELVVIRPPVNSPHPRSYIHGALFLFRSPSEKAALSYDLSAALVWNAGLIAEDVGKEVASAIHSVIPEARL